MRTETKVEVGMKQLLDTLEPESLRFRVLNCATKFKSNWMDLGEMLNSLLHSEEFESWGYHNFEDYCKIELKIKLDTAMKLVSSYGFLKKHKPSLTQPENRRPVPDYKMISQLIEAENNPEISEGDFRTLKEAVFNDNLSQAGLKKQIRTLAGETESDEDEHERQLERMRSSVQNLKKMISRYDPEIRVLDALHSIEDFIEKIEV